MCIWCHRTKEFFDEHKIKYREIYVDKDHIPSVLSGYGTAVISTSKGLLTDKEARKQGMGGELICQIW